MNAVVLSVMDVGNLSTGGLSYRVPLPCLGDKISVMMALKSTRPDLDKSLLLHMIS
jgi:hypothetical protein